MKKLEGMRPPVLVRAEEGQNGERGPSPSACMETGTTLGFRMRSGGVPKRSERASAKAERQGGRPAREQDGEPGGGECDVEPENRAMVEGRSGGDQIEAEDRREQQRNGFRAAAIAPEQPRGAGRPEYDVQQHVRDIENGRGRKGGDVSGVQDQECEQPDHSTSEPQTRECPRAASCE